MPSLYRNQQYLCEVAVGQSARGPELTLTPGREDITPTTPDVFHLHHRGRMLRLRIVETFVFGPETRLLVQIIEDDF